MGVQYNRDSLARLAMEDSSARAGAPVGIFVGVTTNDYQLMGEEMLGKTDVIGHSLPWSIANRVSYCLNLTGPSMPVDITHRSIHQFNGGSAFLCAGLRGQCNRIRSL